MYHLHRKKVTEIQCFEEQFNGIVVTSSFSDAVHLSVTQGVFVLVLEPHAKSH